MKKPKIYLLSTVFLSILVFVGLVSVIGVEGQTGSLELTSRYFEYIPFGASNIFVQDNIAFLLFSDGASIVGIKVYDISQINQPKQLTYYPLADPTDIKVVGDCAYMSGGKIDSDVGYLKILNVSNPQNIYQVGSVSLPHGAASVEIKGNYAYLGGWDAGLFVINISDKSTPSLIRTVTFPRIDNPNPAAKLLCLLKPPAEREKFPCKLGRTWWNHIDGNYLYINDENTGLHILNISNPASPQEVGSFIDETMSEDSRLSVDAFNDAYLVNNVAYIAIDHGGMLIIDVSNKSNPSLIAHYDPWKGYEWNTSPGHMIQITVKDNIAYLSAGEEGVYLVDVSNSSNPTLIKNYPTRSDVGSSWGLFLKDNSVFVTYIGVDPGGKSAGLKGGWEIFEISSGPPLPRPKKNGDLNNDTKVDIIDLGILLSHWGSLAHPPADINQDGKVDVIDLGVLLSNWG